MNFRIRKLAGFVLVLWLVGALLAACQPIRPEATMAQAVLSAEEQFVEAALALEEAYQNEDLESVIAFYAEDALSYAPGFPTDVGKEAIKVAYQSYFDAYDLQREFELLEVDMRGDYATRTGSWTQVVTPVDGSEPLTEIGRCILGWQKINGEWKVVWEIWNTYEAQPVQ